MERKWSMPWTEASPSRTRTEHPVNAQPPRNRGLSRPLAGMGHVEQRDGEYVVEWQLFPMAPARPADEGRP